jgi:hypothetical protein
MRRLASSLKLTATDLFRSPEELIEDAYEKQESRIAPRRASLADTKTRKNPP